MFVCSYSDVFNLTNEREGGDEIHAGDLVCTGPNLFPYFEVVALNGDKAWVRNVQTGEDHLALVTRCRRMTSAEPALATTE